jgi:membrane-associated protease RseP (regulator of RpoE activity)
MINALLLWIILLGGFYFAYTMGAASAAARRNKEREHLPEPPEVPSEKLAASAAKLAPLMAITGHKAVGDVFQFEGHLRGPAEKIFPQIESAFADGPLTPLLLEGDHHDVRVLVMPKEKLGERAGRKEDRPNWALHLGLFLATIATTTWAGALHDGVNLLQEPGRFAVGLPYSLGLLLILGAHEMGHYLTARLHGIRVTPPYFIPVPFSLGTFGAFIKIKSLTPDRRALFDVAVAGPLAGLVFAIPALLIGLRYSTVLPDGAPLNPSLTGVSAGSSLLLAVLAKLSLGASMVEGHHIELHPLAFAGWLGLLVTALNLVPIGQLDGGHISHAMFGLRASSGLSKVALVGLFALALFVWPGLMFWAFIVFFIAGTHDSPAANDVTALDGPRQAVGYFTFLLLLLIIVPVPPSLYELIGVHSPYM